MTNLKGLLVGLFVAAIIPTEGAGEVRGTFLKRFFSDFYLPQGLVTAALDNVNVSETCARDVSRFVEQIEILVGNEESNKSTTLENWALQMFDAWAKIPEGILSGHVTSLGDFDECLDVRAPNKNDESSFRGKYCLAFVFPNTTSNGEGGGAKESVDADSESRTLERLMNILAITSVAELAIIPSIGSCLPSTCSDEETLRILQTFLPQFGLIPVQAFCTTDEPEKMEVGAIATLSFFGILTGFILLGTGVHLAVDYDYISLSQEAKKSSKLFQICLSFSIASNGKKFLSTKTSSSDITCLHGIRFLSASWVVLGHTFLMVMIQPLWNLVEVYSVITTDTSFLVIGNASIVVDVFFVMGGFLVSLTLLPMLEKTKGKLNVPLLYLHRYLRVTPMYMIVVMLGTFVFPMLSNGPYWFVVDTWAGFCKKNWWKNMLYINNLPIYDGKSDPQDSACHGIAWYLGVDMQLFVLSPFLLFPVWKWKRYGVVPIALLTLVSIILPGVITYVNDFPPMSLPFKSLESNFSQEGYTPTYMRAAAYLIGMCTGILFHWVRSKTAIFKLQKLVVVGSWLLAFVVGFTVLLSPQKFFNPEYTFKTLESALYASGHRVAWAVAISWLIFACATGHGGWINRILSWSPFVPLGRLTFAIYLVSLHLQFLFHLQYRQPIYFSKYHVTNLFFAHLVMSCLVAVVCTLVIEAPFMQLLKMIVGPQTRGKKTLKERKTTESSKQAGLERSGNDKSHTCSVSHVTSSVPENVTLSHDVGMVAPSTFGSSRETLVPEV